MLCVYVAGPYRGANAWIIAQNIREAEILALDVWRLGVACICPHTNTAHFQGAADDEVWLQGDLELLRRSDALITTARWEQSSGARAEVEYARQQGIPIFHEFDDLADWVRAQASVSHRRLLAV